MTDRLGEVAASMEALGLDEMAHNSRELARVWESAFEELMTAMRRQPSLPGFAPLETRAPCAR